MDSTSKPQTFNRRRLLSYAGLMALCYPVLSFIGFKIPKKPVFTAINKAVSTSGFLITNDFILFDRNSTCWALSRKCTHLGCKLNYHEELDLLECPCHQSQFHASTGQVIKGPAKKPLSFFPVEKKQGEPRYVVTT